MANIKISQLTPKGANLGASDLLEISEFNGSGYETKSITGQEIIDAAGGGAAFYPVEPLDVDTDYPVGSMTASSGAAGGFDSATVLESKAANIYQPYIYKWINQPYSTLEWNYLDTTSSWTYLTVNNQYLRYYGFYFNNNATITINAKIIGQLLSMGTGGSYNFPNLEALTQGGGSFTLDSNITSFVADNLKYWGNTLNIGNCPSWSMNSLEYVGSLGFANGVPSTVSLPQVKYLGSLSGPSSSSNTLTTLELNGVEYIRYGVSFTSATNTFTTFSFNNLKEMPYNFQTSTTIGFTQATVDHILVKLASLDGTSGTAIYANKTVTVRGAAPSSTGLAAKATLISRGCTVTTS